MTLIHDTIIIGGGIAGLQAAIQLGRYRHNVLVVDNHSGRSTICRAYHNILGWPGGISGPDLRRIGRQQAESYGVKFVDAEVMQAKIDGDEFALVIDIAEHYRARTLLIATGLVDHIPDIAGLRQCLGSTIYVCPDCDGYEIINHPTVVIGAGNVGADMARTLSYWSNDLTYINHEQTEIDDERKKALADKGIRFVNAPVRRILADGETIRAVALADGQELYFRRGFVAFGGNVVKSQLAVQLGVTVLENRHIPVDARTRETNVRGVFAAGDVVAHSEQVTISMGDGAQAAIWIHKRLLNQV